MQRLSLKLNPLVCVCVCVYPSTYCRSVYKGLLCGRDQHDLAEGHSHVCIWGCMFTARAGGSGGTGACAYSSGLMVIVLKGTIHQESRWCILCRNLFS